MVKVYCVNTGTYGEFQEGATLQDIIPAFDFERPYPILAARVNNVTQGLKYRLYNNRDVEFLDYRSYNGRGVYCRSLCFLLCKAVQDVFPGCRITLRRPISKGYFCHFSKPDGSDPCPRDVELISERMKEIVEADFLFRRHEVRVEEAIKIFTDLGYDDKVKLLRTSDQLYISYYTLGDSADYYYDALLPSAGYLKVWALMPYEKGFILRVPDRHHPEDLAPFIEQKKTFEVFSEIARWNSIMGLENVGDVNAACLKGNASDLIQVAEALQEKKIVQIAEEIDKRFHDEEHPVRVVLITGPSSSGKTTFCHRLSIQLKACGLHPCFFSTDDYFVNRADTPRLPDGSFDFDNFETVDHAALEKDVLKLLAGESVEVPEYNFRTGIREYNGKTIQMDDDTVLLIEGIHALNPALIPNVDEGCKFRVFIGTLTSISLDDHNSIPTSDNRLLRRIVRDFNKGAFTAQETIRQWPNVRCAEVKWIYPYQETADVLFNSAYLMEFAVLRNHAERILATVPRNCREYGETHRLLKFLHYFVPVSDKDVPATSLIRSFIGGSSFN